MKNNFETFKNGGYKSLLILILTSVLTVSLGLNIFYLKSDRSGVLSQVNRISDNVECMKDKINNVESLLLAERRTIVEIARLLRYGHNERIKEGADDLYQHLKDQDLHLKMKRMKDR